MILGSYSERKPNGDWYLREMESSSSPQVSTPRSGSREDSLKGADSKSSIKSLEKRSSSNTGSVKSDKDIPFTTTNYQKPVLVDPTLRVSHKFIANWRQACDRTRDKTRDLLKRWKTLPENDEATKSEDDGNQEEKKMWSVHIWTTWVERFSVDISETWDSKICDLTSTQREKFSHFFTYLLDHDRDDIISEEDFEMFSERLRHFADWSTNSAEFNILQQVESGFMETFLKDNIDEELGFKVNGKRYLTKDGWLRRWAILLTGSKSLSDFPIWLKYLVKILFQSINRSGSGTISKDELNAFYSSVLGYDTVKVNEIIDSGYSAMTSNGDHLITYNAYKLCFANFLLARYPNGSGQSILGYKPTISMSALFPVDYSALNTEPDDLEQYAPDQKSNRRSVIV